MYLVDIIVWVIHLMLEHLTLSQHKLPYTINIYIIQYSLNGLYLYLYYLSLYVFKRILFIFINLVNLCLYFYYLKLLSLLILYLTIFFSQIYEDEKSPKWNGGVELRLMLISDCVCRLVLHSSVTPDHVQAACDKLKFVFKKFY